jgi:hypothetical protein
MQRRQLLQGAAGLGLMAGWHGAAHARHASTDFPTSARALPLSAVRLLPSIYAQALQANQAYLLRLSADRFLHNYHRFAGMPTKGAIYGGWESDTIAGEGLGHYLSALSLMYAQTGNAAPSRASITSWPNWRACSRRRAMAMWRASCASGRWLAGRWPRDFP